MSKPPPSPAEAMHQLADAMTQVIEAVTGYRAKLETAGFSPRAAEAMSIDYHRALMGAVLPPRTK